MISNTQTRRRRPLCSGIPWLLLFALTLSGPWLAGCSGLRGGGAAGPVPPNHVRVVFTYSGEGDSVCLSGDFNKWSPSDACLQPVDDGWRTTVDLKPGKYAYGFLVDNSQWVPDPLALLFEDDGFGQKNSVIIVD